MRKKSLISDQQSCSEWVSHKSDVDDHSKMSWMSIQIRDCGPHTNWKLAIMIMKGVTTLSERWEKLDNPKSDENGRKKCAGDLASSISYNEPCGVTFLFADCWFH